MDKIIALKRIVFGGKQYNPGEELPYNDPEMVDAWKRAGSVKLSQELETDMAEEETNIKDKVSEPGGRKKK